MIIMTTANDADLRLRDFKVLGVVLRERSLTRAAEALETTQPSVSKVLARLRTHFGDPLFVRHGQAMHPTPKALEMADPLRGLLLAADTLAQPTKRFDPHTSDRVFKILTADVGMALFFPEFIKKVVKEGPKLSLQAVPLAAGHFETKLESGEADLAVGAFAKVPRGLRRQRLFFDGYLSLLAKPIPIYADCKPLRAFALHGTFSLRHPTRAMRRIKLFNKPWRPKSLQTIFCCVCRALSLQC
jgi:DNA-binding transcriptional LysR family regulator